MLVMSSHGSNLTEIAKDLLTQVSLLEKRVHQHSFDPPNLTVGANTQLWATHDEEIEGHRSNILALTQYLEKLILGPSGFLHEYVSTNWEYGALYTLIEYSVLEKIPLNGDISVDQLAEQVALPVDKLLSVCRLVVCVGILKELGDEKFAHTVFSEHLVKDEGFKAFVGFQLYETRVASAYLADSLRDTSPFWVGKSAFEHAWGVSMYDWHANHPDKGTRFSQAMSSVSRTFDPGNRMIINWFFANPEIAYGSKSLVVEFSGRHGSISDSLKPIFPQLYFEIRDLSIHFQQGSSVKANPGSEDRTTFDKCPAINSSTDGESKSEITNMDQVILLRGMMWNLDDEQCIDLLRSFIPVLKGSSRSRLLVSDLVSPRRGCFPPHQERAYRRRDVTLMTMHNAKQRTTEEWALLIQKASPLYQCHYSEEYTSHCGRGLWQVQIN